MADIPESKMLPALRGGAHSVAEIAKATGADKEDVEATLADYRARQLAEVDTNESTSKTERWRLTMLGKQTVATRYPE